MTIDPDHDEFRQLFVKVVPLYLIIYPLRQFRPRVTIINSQMEKTDGRNHEEKKKTSHNLSSLKSRTITLISSISALGYFGLNPKALFNE